MKILLVGDPVLRQPTEPVVAEEVKDLLSKVPEMKRLMEDAGGLALAANQVGITKRFFIIGIPEEITRIIFNPEIIELGERQPHSEGCLSIPGTTAQIPRSLMVKIKYRDHHFVEKEETFNGVIARAVQHEIDHLNGKLYLDYLAPARRMLAMVQHRKYLGRLRRN